MKCVLRWQAEMWLVIRISRRCGKKLRPNDDKRGDLGREIHR